MINSQCRLYTVIMGNCGCSQHDAVYSELVDGSADRLTETGVYRPKGVIHSRLSGDTLFSVFQTTAQRHSDHKCLDSMTYRQVDTMVKELGRGIVRLSLAKKMIGVSGDNTPLCLVADLAIMS